MLLVCILSLPAANAQQAVGGEGLVSDTVVPEAFLTPSASEAAAVQLGPLEADCRFGYWSGNRAQNNERHVSANTCFLSERVSLLQGWQASINARVGYGDAQQGDDLTGRVREAHVGNQNWRLGRQIISWGRADRINPTDVFSPRDFTALVPEDEEQKQGINALYGRWLGVGGQEGTSVHAVVAQFEAHRLPQPSLPVPRTVQDRDDLEWALRVDHVGEGVDGSVLYYQGYERSPNYQPQAQGPGVVGLVGRYRQTRTLGADIAAVAGPYTLRSEATVASVQGQRKQRLVLGADQDIAENTNLNVQLLRQRSQTSHQETAQNNAAQVLAAAQAAGLAPAQANALAASGPGSLSTALGRLNQQLDDVPVALSYRLATRLKNDSIRLEWVGLWAYQEQAHLLRPRLYYTLNDSSRLIVGFDKFHGRDTTFFGARRPNNAFFMQWAAYF